MEQIYKKYCYYYYSDSEQSYLNGQNYFKATVVKGGGSIGILSKREDNSYYVCCSRIFHLDQNKNNNDHVSWRPVLFGYQSDDGRFHWNDESNNSDIDYEMKPYDLKQGSGGGPYKMFHCGNGHKNIWLPDKVVDKTS